MRILQLLLLFSTGTLYAGKLYEKIQDDEEIGNGITANTWRLTVQSHPDQLILTTFLVEVGEALKEETGLTSRKVEVIHYVPKGDYVQDVGYRRFWNEDREAYDPQLFDKWQIFGLGQNVTLGPMDWVNGGGGCGTLSNVDPPAQRVHRRFKLTSSLEDAINGKADENPSTHIFFNFVVEAVLLKDAVAKAAEAGVDELPELNGTPWSVTLPQVESSVEQGGAEEPATRAESEPEGGHQPRPEAEGRSR